MCAPAAAATIRVPVGANLQQAIDTAQPGDVIALDAGATYAGNFVLGSKPAASFITIRTAGDQNLPGDGGRIDPSRAPLLAKIRSTNGSPAIATAPGAHHWRLQLVEVLANAAGAGDIITLGDGSALQTSLAQIPHDLAVDRVYVHGDPARGQKRGIALNSAATSITGCYIADIKAVGQDSQAIAGWNGPGPFTIVNNYLEAAGENLLFGGADPSVRDLVPADITISGNNFAKPTEWRGSAWTVKNLLELKNARRVTVERNTFSYNWAAAQAGFAILLTVRNQDGGCPWCQVDHVTFRANVVQHSGAGIQILGVDNLHPSQQTQALVIRDNIFADIDSQNWGGNGYFVSLVGGARDVTIDHNTVIQDHAFGVVQVDGPPVLGFTFTNNLAKHNLYGIIGSDHGVGMDSIAAFFPGSAITQNVLAGGAANRYPSGNSFPSTAQFEAQFVAYGASDYHLVGASPWRRAGTDGADLGAPIDRGVGAGAADVAPPRDSGPTPDTPELRPMRLRIGARLPEARVGEPYAATLRVNGAELATWRIASGRLPAGVGFDSASGTFAGAPQESGTFAVRVVADDIVTTQSAEATAILVVRPRVPD